MSIDASTHQKRPALPITVCVASYNHARYVEEAVRSLATQSAAPAELIVVDDGSTDGSQQHLRDLEKRYPLTLILQENRGLISVLNDAVARARSEFFLLHASDDVSLPGRLNHQVTVLRRFPRAAFVSSNFEFLTEKGEQRGTLHQITGEQRELSFLDLFLRREAVSSVTSMYRTAALKELDGLDPRYRAEDPQIFLKLTYKGYTWVQDRGEPVLRYRMLQSSQSRTTMPLLIRQNLELLSEFAECPDYPVAVAKVRAALVSVLAESDKREAILELAKGDIDWASQDVLRAFVKILLPKSLHRRFKKAG